MRRIVGAVVLLAALAGAVLALGWRAPIPAIEPASRERFAREQVERGAVLAGASYCAVCHTTPGGAPYAGGRGLETPFGTIYATNITPDPDTGIGRWPEDAFRRALHEGVRRDGAHLYPAFPYDHFTLTSDADVAALYAFLMTRDPVRAEAPPNRLPFPLNVRMAVAGWKLLFFREGRFQPDPARSAELNRGAYLAEGLGHCGGCHTPRNVLGAERRGDAYGGGESEGWHAPALNANSPAPVPWTADSLFAYLRTGSDDRHGVAAGPMAPVVRSLSRLPDPDIRAIAAYVATLQGPVPPERQRRADALLAALDRPEAAPSGSDAAGRAGSANPPERAGAGAAGEGATVFAGSCALCHEPNGAMPQAARSLALHTGLTQADPRNFLNIVLHGIQPEEGESGPLMPGFAGALTDRQVAAVAAYARERFGGGRPPWTGLDDAVRRLRRTDDPN